MPRVEFLFDFGSPNAFLAHRVIPAMVARTGVPVVYEPVLLGGIFKATGNESPGTAYAHIRNKPEYERLEIDRFVARHGIDDYVFNSFFPINTLALMRGAIAAQRLAVFELYLETVFDRMWSHPLKMDDPDVVHAVLTEAGLDAGALIALAQTHEVKAALMANTQRAVERGAFGAPTFFVGDDIWFGKDRLRDVEEAILSRGASCDA